VKRRSKASIGPAKARRRKAQKPKDRNTPTVRRRGSAGAGLQTELGQLRRELHDAQEQQTATADVLKVISRSTFDLEVVLKALIESAARLCHADKGSFRLATGEFFHHAASYGYSAEQDQYMDAHPVPAEGDRGSIVGRVLDEGRVVQVEDTKADPEFKLTNVPGFESIHTTLGVPLLREGRPIGVLVLMRSRVERFSEKQVELVTTFADQAVIAIENARLLSELRESLRQQTATAEVLKVISRSTFNLQTVLDTLVESVARLCEADIAAIHREKELGYQQVATYGYSQKLKEYVSGNIPLAPVRGSVVGRTVLEGKTVHVSDVLADPEYTLLEFARQAGIRTALGIPLLREEKPIGVIFLARCIVRPFTDREVELATTFADQAVIAIENVRLFDEVQARTRDLSESLEQQIATADVLKVISRSTFDLQAVLNTLVESAARLCEADSAAIHRPKGEAYRYVASYGYSREYDEYMGASPIVPGRGSVLWRAVLEGRAVQVADVLADPNYALIDAQRIGGFRTTLGVPLMREGVPIGVIMLTRNIVRPFSDKQVELVTTFADQAVIAIENVRLFDEIQDKSRELEIASQHKSQFVANMSHELRTPLAAMLGYAELMQEGIYEPLGEKSLAALTRIRSNGKHLLGLINTVLDIAKIESGQFTLNMQEYSIETVVETVRVATESLAQHKKLALRAAVTKPLPIGIGDEQRLTQVLLNLVGNAIKFTDTGEVRVTAEAVDGRFAISVVDTGPGIPEQERTRIFEQFHQVDDSNTKSKGGTGLGLAIAKQIVEMHGGRIWVDSTVGKGSTFQMELPIRAEKIIA
jgi:signal transduction histidine kinase